ncbi:recombinase family protein [Kiritimatiella glycovorans]|uniref:Resolvase/invertase-type recombinase catalytic domain-containing protein n=1 Tax=Kiritimatiella glycovorans TaxID=1307763 RepID=A0A0G3EE86_9BACT|nr:recombinase family protein [Kiritimatiella glycovorans]AKJ64771.1 hypothetical protein L21SP4_01526 [Kiritimatiella glycovorans]
MMRRQRCAIYTRQSSEPSHRETSCKAQFDTCLKFIASMKPIGLELTGTRYDDAGYGGATLDRPALRELIQSVRTGCVDIVVVEYLDRLSRSVFDVLTLMESFRDHGVDLRIVTCPDLTISPSDNFMINPLASYLGVKLSN